MERNYKLRALKDSDLFLIMKIIKKLGVKELESLFTVDKADKSDEEVGKSIIFNLIDMIVDNLDKVENEIYELCSKLTNMSVEELRNAEFGTLPLIIFDVFSEVKNTNFFKVVFKLL